LAKSPGNPSVSILSGQPRAQRDSDGQLVAITHFETPKELSETELAQLKDDYDAQMSDGIGENFLTELQTRPDVQFRLEVFWLYDSAIRSQIQQVK